MTKENKSLSQQICELCGLEYEKKTSYREIKDPLYNQSIGTLKEEIRKLDFENPENFVKLLELKFKNEENIEYQIGEWLWCCGKDFYDRKTFLEVLIKRLEINYQPVYEIKQAIRNYDGWVWGNK